MTINISVRRVFKQTLFDGAHAHGPAFRVPADIARPHARRDTKFAQRLTGPEIDAARISAKIAASALSLARKVAVEGTTTEEVDTEVARYICSRKAYPSGIGFMGFPKAICQSVNEIIAHGIPNNRPLITGDIVNFDITAYTNGYFGDNSDMVAIGDIDDNATRLIDATREALHRAITTCRPGARFSTIADEIQSVATREQFGVVDYFCGHFIGSEMHIAPNIHHTRGHPSMDTLVMEPGMLFTIEPILVEGSPEGEVWSDGWTYVTKDKGRTAQAEHMVLITPGGHEILTIPDDSF